MSADRQGDREHTYNEKKPNERYTHTHTHTHRERERERERERQTDRERDRQTDRQRERDRQTERERERERETERDYGGIGDQETNSQLIRLYINLIDNNRCNSIEFEGI